MRTNIDIDDSLMKKALNEYVKYQMRLKLLSLQGKVEWIGDLNKMRTYNKGEIIFNKSLKQKIKNYENEY